MKIALIISVLLVTTGCATRSDLVAGKPHAIFQSTLIPKRLASCIDKNVDENSVLGALQSKILDSGTESYEVIVRGGATTYALVQITQMGNGSTATMYFGGAAFITPDDAVKRLTTGCK